MFNWLHAFLKPALLAVLILLPTATMASAQYRITSIQVRDDGQTVISIVPNLATPNGCSTDASAVAIMDYTDQRSVAIIGRLTDAAFAALTNGREVAIDLYSTTCVTISGVSYSRLNAIRVK